MLAEVLPKIAAETIDKTNGVYRPRPSLAGPERCVRQLVYKAIGTPESPLPGRAVLVMDDSSWHEELTADWINKSSYRLHSQQMVVEIPDAYAWRRGMSQYICGSCQVEVNANDLHGHIDGVFTDLLGKDFLLEHKAINHFSFNRIWQGNWPKDYIAQCVIYIRAMQNTASPDISECLLLIKNKNTAQYIELLLDYDTAIDQVRIVEVVRSDGERYKPDEIIEKVYTNCIDKFRAVDSYATAYYDSEEKDKEKALPARPFDLGTDFPCGYCRYERTCWGNYSEEFDKLAKDSILDKEIEELCGYYLEVSGHASDILKEMTKEKDALKAKIKNLLKAAGVRSGKAGDYVVRLALQTRTGVDEALIPMDILEKARRVTEFERLYINKPKRNGVNGK